MKELGVILVVEDDARDIELLKASLRPTGLEDRLFIVRDGESALNYLRRQGEFDSRSGANPVVVLLDIKMPKIGGIEVLSEIKSDQMLQGVPVVILTSSRQPSDLKTCYGLGVNAYVVKPMKFNEYVSAIQSVGEFWGRINEPTS